MKKFNITKEHIGNIVKIGGIALVYGLVSMASRTSVKEMFDNIRYSGNVTYSDAISAVMDSDMFDSSKTKVIELLKRDQSVEYYKTIIDIVRSNMFDSNKIKAITILCEEKES